MYFLCFKDACFLQMVRRQKTCLVKEKSQIVSQCQTALRLFPDVVSPVLKEELFTCKDEQKNRNF